MYRSLIYSVYSIINIMIFSFFSISLYQLFCTPSETDFFVLESLSTKIKYSSFFFLENLSSQSVLFITYSILHVILDLNIYISSISSFFFDDFIYYSYYNIFQLYIFTKTCTYYEDIFSSLNFFCLHDFIWIIPNETILLFFRLWNKNLVSFECVSIYVIYPYESNVMLVKLQCFCFSSILVSSNELVELPVIFFFDHLNLNLLVKQIYIYYLLIPYNLMNT